MGLKAVILAGGLGTRLMEETVLRPKPMVEIGGRPLLWHVMKIYAHHGVRDFIVCLGYKAQVIKEYFLNYHAHASDLTVNLADGSVDFHRPHGEDWRVMLVDTGLHTQTGGRLLRVRDHIGADDFFLTYGDGLSDLDIGALLAFHRAEGRLATVTAVAPPARFGALDLDGARVAAFREKPQGGDGAINGGFFVVSPAALDHIAGDDTAWELGPLQALAAAGQLSAYRHPGFWHAVDTPRDRSHLEALWRDGRAPWRVW